MLFKNVTLLQGVYFQDYILKLLGISNLVLKNTSFYIMDFKITDRKRSRFSNSNIIASLVKRLKGAEEKLEFVKCEISSIKNELLLFQEHDNEDNVDSLNQDTKRLLYSFTKEDNLVVVYTDGACENNGKPNAKAGIGVWFGENHPLNISKPVSGRATNNTAEIQACTSAIMAAHKNGIQKLKIKTDSQFVINSITQWINKWKKNNWKTISGKDVKNKEDFVALDKSIQLLEKVSWEHVEGHQGVNGNENADKLARAGAALYKSFLI